MEIETLVVGALKTNCYLVFDQQTKEAIIIDPGDEGEFISEKILRLGLTPQLIVATHGHFDHLLAAWELQTNFRLPFFIHEKDLFLLKRMRSSARFWLKQDIPQPPPQNPQPINESDQLQIGNFSLQVISTPGHSPGSICLWEKSQKILFSGDTLFCSGPGRTDFKYGSPQAMKESLEKLSSLPEETEIFPGHSHSCFLKDALFSQNLP